MIAPVGSRWYYLGAHWVVEGPTEKDGEPAVWLRSAKNPKVKRTDRLCALDRHGVRTDREEGA